MLISLERKCRYPYYLKGENLYVHPEDAPEFWNDLQFISVACFPYLHEIHPNQIGRILNLNLYIQDDLQILLLAMNGGISIED